MALPDIGLDFRGEMEGIFGRIACEVAEWGYERFAERMEEKGTEGGFGSTLLGPNVNIIPSRTKTVCTRVVIAISRGRNPRSAMGFPKVMQALKTHLIDCAGITKVAVILCDSWDSQEFVAQHFNELQAHYRKGVRFVFLLAGVPGRKLSRVPVDLR